VVDVDDLARMADDWLQSGSLADIYPPPYGDDTVNFQDFAVLAERPGEITSDGKTQLRMDSPMRQ
jgi:hypothetical protein